MKNKKEFTRPAFAIIASILILLSTPARECGQISFSFFLIFLGSLIFGGIFQSIREGRAKKK